ncbi:hypothetical protein EKK58_06345 [Candidatus Dependentiae bacterium]|nr:MAG: hypothetical protein EKK58_06345 [Candidatus Dependentiae bacterium]
MLGYNNKEIENLKVANKQFTEQQKKKMSWQKKTAIGLGSLLGLLTIIHFSAKYSNYITKFQQDVLSSLSSCLNYVGENTLLNLKALKGVSAS